MMTSDLWSDDQSGITKPCKPELFSQNREVQT